MNNHTESTTGGGTFADAVRAEFAFLVDRGFDLHITSDDSLTYEADSGVFVKVFRDPRDGYAGFRAGFSTRPKDALTSAELARLSGTSSRGEYPASSAEYRAAVGSLADLLRHHGERLLEGDGSILDEAMELRRQYTKQYTTDQRPSEPETGP